MKPLKALILITSFIGSVACEMKDPQVSSNVEELKTGYFLSFSPLYADGSYGGEVRSSPSPLDYIWDVTCTTNQMSDQSECTTTTKFSVLNRDLDVLDIVLYGEDASNPKRLCLSDHDYPGRVAYIRFDTGKRISLGEDGCTASRAVISKLFQSDSVVVQSVSWPYGLDTPVRLEIEAVEEFLNLAKRLDTK